MHIAAIGMGAHAVSFDDGFGKEITIDFPHRVLSPRYYLNLSTLLHKLDVKLKPEDYCLSVSDLGGKTFFYWRNLRIFGRLLPTINPISVLKHPMTYFTVIRDAWCFFNEAKRDLEAGVCNNLSTGEYFDHLIIKRGYSRILIDQMIRPSLSSTQRHPHRKPISTIF
jgi:predicted NAD/FAD-binding protein